MLSIYPHQLAYFNELAGGPENGHKHLLHSNFNWGQDLLFVGDWLRDMPDARPFHLVYHGGFDPADVGVRSSRLASVNEGVIKSFPFGWCVIDESYLAGFQQVAYVGVSRAKLEQSAIDDLRGGVRVKTLGSSVCLFYLCDNE